MTAERVQARVFGEVAEEYDRIRAGYPASLVADVLAYAQLDAAPALEAGAGTGKATAQFAERGLAVTAIEPDPEMAAVLTRRVVTYPHVTVTVCAFEDYAPSQPFGLLFSAQAWHWMDPAARWQRAAAALAPGGALALFWNSDRPASTAVTATVLEVHRNYAPGIVLDFEPCDATRLRDTWPCTELATRSEFGQLSQRLYRAQRVMSTTDYLALLSTQSAYRMLDDTTRTTLFGALEAALDEQVTLDIDTVLYLVRRLPR